MTDEQEHQEARLKRHKEQNAEANATMEEAHEAIQALKRGEQVHVSRECMARYGANIKYWREGKAGKKAKVIL